jgi:hypothetical protein
MMLRKYAIAFCQDRIGGIDSLSDERAKQSGGKITCLDLSDV